MGADGGYRLVAGNAMPPLLLDDEEAVAIAVGLRAGARARRRGRRGGVRTGAGQAGTGAAVPAAAPGGHAPGRPPSPLTGGDGATIDPETSDGASPRPIAGQERLRFALPGGRRHAQSRRLVEPYRLVVDGPPLVPRGVRPRPRRLADLPGRPGERAVRHRRPVPAARAAGRRRGRLCPGADAGDERGPPGGGDRVRTGRGGGRPAGRPGGGRGRTRSARRPAAGTAPPTRWSGWRSGWPCWGTSSPSTSRRSWPRTCGRWAAG